MKLVVRAAPLTVITELVMKLLPIAVRVVGPLPAIAADGEMLLREGTGLLTVSLRAGEVPPPGVGLKTVIDK